MAGTYRSLPKMRNRRPSASRTLTTAAGGGRKPRWLPALALAAALLPGFGRTWAADYDAADFSLRLPASFSRFSSYASVTAGGNAQAASEWPSSANPASCAWPHPQRLFAHSASAQFNAIPFDAGTALFVAGESLALDAGKWGVFLPVAVQVRSNHELTRAGTGFDFYADYYQLQWARPIADRWTAGLNLNYTATATRFDVGGAPAVETRSDTYAARLGLLGQVAPKLRLGLTLDYGCAPAWTDRFDFLNLGVGTRRAHDSTQRILGRTGLVWNYHPRGNLYLDYQGGTLWNDTGTLWVHRFPIGVEHWLVPRLLLGRAGMTVDTRGEVSPSVGIGLQAGRRTFLNLAYQYNMFPELKRDFDAAQTIAFSIGVGF